MESIIQVDVLVKIALCAGGDAGTGAGIFNGVLAVSLIEHQINRADTGLTHQGDGALSIGGLVGGGVPIVEKRHAFKTVGQVNGVLGDVQCGFVGIGESRRCKCCQGTKQKYRSHKTFEHHNTPLILNY